MRVCIHLLPCPGFLKLRVTCFLAILSLNAYNPLSRFHKASVLHIAQGHKFWETGGHTSQDSRDCSTWKFLFQQRTRLLALAFWAQRSSICGNCESKGLGEKGPPIGRNIKQGRSYEGREISSRLAFVPFCRQTATLDEVKTRVSQNGQIVFRDVMLKLVSASTIQLADIFVYRTAYDRNLQNTVILYVISPSYPVRVFHVRVTNCRRRRMKKRR